MDDNPSSEGGFGRVWLERGIAAARAGRRPEARESLFRALNDEAQRETAWLWLAAVSDDPRQEQMYLEKVLELNPDNLHARAGIAHLERRGLKDLPTLLEADEVLEGEDQSGEVKSVVRTDEEEKSADARVSSGKGLAQSLVLDSALGQNDAHAAEGEMAAASTDEHQASVDRSVQEEVDSSPDREEECEEKTEIDDEIGDEGAENGYELESILPEKFQELEELIVGAEPTGWTTNTPIVDRAVPVRQSSPDRVVAQNVILPRVEPQYSDRSEYAPPRPAFRPTSRPVPGWRRLLHSEGQISTIVNEAFNDHEMWAVLAAAVGLILLAFVVAFFFALSLISG